MKLLIITLLLANILHARIGETLEQVKKRYGKIMYTSKTKLDWPIYSFKKNGFLIFVIIYKNKCACIRYLRSSGIKGKFSNSIRKGLISANAAGKKMAKIEPGVWMTYELDLVAVEKYDVPLKISTKAWVLWKEAQQEKIDKNKIEGL